VIEAMVMAGGAGSRMRASGIALPKPLVEVGGRPLLAWNLSALARLGLDRVTVVLPAGGGPIADWIAAEGRALLPGLVLVEEGAPLGNVGAAGWRAGGAQALLLTFADNLSGLDLSAFLSAHRATHPAMTLATHRHRVPVPYGVLELEGEAVVSYREKAPVEVVVSSGYYVLGPPALQFLADRGRCGASELVSGLLAAGQSIRSFAHAAPWVDVNDASDRARAEAIVAANRALFFP